MGGIAPGSFNMVPVSGDGGGGNGSASPAAESKLKERERRSRLVSMLGELLQNLCRLASNAIVVSDATALGRLVQCVGLFGPLLQQQPSVAKIRILRGQRKAAKNLKKTMISAKT